MQAPCQQCGRPFEVHRSHLLLGTRKHCSRKCSDAHRRSISVQERFLKRMGQPPNTDECWIWTGTQTPDGYGVLRANNKNTLVHRIAYELFYGDLSPGYSVCHHCDNPPCCNPRHLFCGKAADNARDMMMKGRSTRGERNAQSRLTTQQVYEIRTLLASDTKGTCIAQQFYISPALVSAIKYKTRWAYLP